MYKEDRGFDICDHADGIYFAVTVKSSSPQPQAAGKEIHQEIWYMPLGSLVLEHAFHAGKATVQDQCPHIFRAGESAG
jgi:hypothetical protein